MWRPGRSIFDQRFVSAWSVRKLCPGLLVHLFSDLPLELFAQNGSSPFHSHALIEKPHPRSKVDYIHQSPFEETLFLDTDTEVTVDIQGSFHLARKIRYGPGARLRSEHTQRTLENTESATAELPGIQHRRGALPQNSGRVVRLLQAWSASYHAAGFFPDQITLRELLWESDLRIGVLPPEYNTIMIKYPFVWRKGEAIPKIMHLRKYHEGPFWLLHGLRRSLRRAGLRLKGRADFLVKK